MQENERKDLIVSNQKFNISEFIKRMIQSRNYNKFRKNVINDAIKHLYSNPKTLKYWNKMSDEDKIQYIMEYTTDKNIFDQSEYRKYGNPPIYGDIIYREEFFDTLISNLWKNSNHNVQSNTYVNYQNIVNDVIININAYIFDENWKYTNPKLQQEIILKIINMQTRSISLDSSNIDAVTLYWKYGKKDMTDVERNECKCEAIIDKLNEMNEISLLEIYDKVEDFISNNANEEQMREFIGELPENIRKEKVYNSVEYLLRDGKKFETKWETLSYEEKLSEFKNIFSKYTKEYSSSFELTNDRNKSIIDNIYPKYFIGKDKKNSMSKETYLNFNPDALKIAFKGIKSEDLDKLIYGIIEEKKNSPIILYSIWSALDRSSQKKYYDRTMQILKDKPECKLEIWNSSKVDSNNKDKKILKALSEIKTEEDLKKYEKNMREMIRGKKNIQKKDQQTTKER